MTKVPDAYPGDLSSEELEKVVRELTQATGWRAQQFENILPELQLAVIQSGLQEQTRRLIEASSNETAAATKLAKFSVAVAAVTLLATMALGVFTLAHDTGGDQSKILTEIRDQLAKPKASTG